MIYRFDDIAINSTAKKKPVESDKFHYVGLEHIDSGSFEITRWGSDVAPVGEKLIMQKGDVLFGKRRAYQRKVAIAPFDGIFSAHGMVLRPKEDVICKEFFPFFLSSNQFMDTAIRISVGGLSPTINWKDLQKQEFELPSIEEQRVLADKLWAAYELKEAYKKMIAATDEMVKSQFIEMFGDNNTVSLCDVAHITMGSSPDSEYYNENGEGLPFYQGKTEFGDMYIKPAVIFCTEPVREADVNDILMSVRAPVGAVNIAQEHCCIGRGLAAIRAKSEKMTPLFLYYALKIKEDNIAALGTGSTFKAINKDVVYSIQIPASTMDEQQKFVAIAQQADKSKFVGFKSQFIEMFGDINDNSNGIPFDEIFYDDTKSATKISASEYLSSGQYAIYDQSQDTQICGYSNDDDGVNMDYPVILFGDHSRVVKLIDRPFYIGADGVKIIRSKQFDLNIVFAYYMIKYCNIPETGYNRHFKYLKLKRFFAPDREKQNQFVAIAQQADKSKYFS